MSFLAHIKACNAHDLTRFKPFLIGDVRYGWLRPAVADLLTGLGADFEATGDGVRLAPSLTHFDARSEALGRAAEACVAAGLQRKLRSEDYAIKNSWHDDVIARINRGAVPVFGVKSYGVHMNGWRRRDDGGVSIWVGRRAMDKAVAPGKLDNMVAGGQPFGLSLKDNLVKEAGEEASMTEGLARLARPVGCISYIMETASGLRDDVMYCFDLETPADFTPVNADGETQYFTLMPAEDIAAAIRSGDGFKFNVNLVMIDFLIRHGLITPDEEPDYASIVSGLQGP